MQTLKRTLLIGGLTVTLATALTTGCKTHETNDGRSVGRVVDDDNITEQVKKELKNEPVYKFDTVEVRTFGGVVQLSGFAATEEQKRRAAELAQRIQGVNQVVNAITVTPEISPAGRESGNRPPPVIATPPSSLTPTNNPPPSNP